MGGDTSDDLPRTLRREREARERDAREREMRAAGASFGPPDAGYSHPSSPVPVVYPDEAPPSATVKRFDVPFLHLVVFFLKAAVAAVPGLIVLAALVIGVTHAASLIYPIRGFQFTLMVGEAPPAKPPVAAPAKK